MSVSETIREIIEKSKNIVITGEEGVGKLRKTIEALKDRDNVYYIGNPFDYKGNWRPKGYDKYIFDVMSLKRDLYIISNEIEILSIDPGELSEQKPVLVIDEIYGRNEAQHEKIAALLAVRHVKVIIVTGCLKNIGGLARYLDLSIMLFEDDSHLVVEREFLNKICSILKPEQH